MKHDLIGTLHTLRRVVPHASRKAEFRGALAARIRADKAHLITARARQTHAFPAFRYAPMTAVFFAVVMLFGMGGASLAARNALPGEMLYPVKLATEKARLTATGDEVKKTALRLVFAGRRLEEAEKLLKKTDNAAKENAGIALAAYEKTLSENETALAKSNEKTAGIAVEIQSAAETHQRAIEKLSEKIKDSESGKKLKERLDTAREKTEEKEDAALMAIISAHPRETITAFSKKAEKKAKEKVEKQEKSVRAAAQDIAQAKSEGRDMKSAEEKIARAEAALARAKEKWEENEIRASLEESIEARKIVQEMQKREKEEKERRDDRRPENAREERRGN